MLAGTGHTVGHKQQVVLGSVVDISVPGPRRRLAVRIAAVAVAVSRLPEAQCLGQAASELALLLAHPAQGADTLLPRWLS